MVLFDRKLDVDIDKLRSSLPAIHKGSDNFIYKTYLKDNRYATFGDGHREVLKDCHWVFDELDAYVIGCKTRKELDLSTREGSHKGGYEFIIYMTYFISLADQNHPDLPKAKLFLRDCLKSLDDTLLTDADKASRIGAFSRDPKFSAFYKKVTGFNLND